MSDTTKSNKTYSLSKSRSILKWVNSWYKRRGSELKSSQLDDLESQLSGLDQAVLAKQREESSDRAKSLESFAAVHCKKTFFDYAKELVIALVFALVVATIVRQMWFELYEIPTGSMRPTFREQDHLTVTKTAFGINFPLETKHLYFDPDLVQRTSVLIFSGDGLPLPDTDTTYFGIFPYKKRYIKRLIAKPGDAIYFYGGRIYGVDKEGNEINELRDAPWMQPLEHIPFLSFDGEVLSSGQNSVLIRQMHKSYGKLSAPIPGKIRGEVYDGKGWVVDDPLAQATPHDSVKTYSDLLGIRNFAEARLLTKEELAKAGLDSPEMEEGVLYLQLRHTPSLSYPSPVDANNNIDIAGYTTAIPLKKEHLDKLMDNLYTARFVVKDGKASRYSLGDTRFDSYSPLLKGVPDGTYEFYYGKASKIGWGGIETAVPADSPLYSRDPQNIQRLYNMGIEFNTLFSPTARNGGRFPHRYAYFRDGSLYLLGVPVMAKGDPFLTSFLAREEKKGQASTSKDPYVAYKDYGPPMKDGAIDKDFIRKFGVIVPEGNYLVLGDNHAMSSDSRVFGFVPQNNIQGAPSLIIWPPGDRLGSPPQKPYPFMTVPRAIVWGIAALIGLLWYLYHLRSLKRPVFTKISRKL